MDQAMGLRDFASNVQRDLKVTFQVRLYDELDHRPCQRSSDSRKRPEAATVEEQGHESCANDEHHQELEECSHQGGISVMHGDHPAIVVGNELHCESNHCGEATCRKRTCHKQVLDAPDSPLQNHELSASAQAMEGRLAGQLVQ